MKTGYGHLGLVFPLGYRLVIKVRCN